jgi:CheY-like chemotaxis protein
MAKALVVEPQELLRKQITQVLKEKGIDVAIATEGREALDLMRASPADVVLISMKMPDIASDKLLEVLRQTSPGVPVIFLSGTGASPSEARRLATTVVRTEPLDVTGLLERVGKAIEPNDRMEPWGSHSMAAHVVRGLHDPDTGRLDAKRIADYLAVPLSSLAEAIEKSPQAVHKSPASMSLQEKLAPIAWTIGALSLVLGSRETVLAWLNSPHPDIGGRTPIAFILKGRSNTIAEMIEAALAGQPS